MVMVQDGMHMIEYYQQYGQYVEDIYPTRERFYQTTCYKKYIFVNFGLWYDYEGMLWSWYQIGYGITMKIGYGHVTR